MENLLHQDWLTRIRSGDQRALQAVFDQQYEAVCRAIFRFVQDPGLSEDLAQEVFVRFWDKRNNIQIDSNLSAYLRRMAVNEALGYLRKKSRFVADELPLHLPGKQAASADEALANQELSQRIQHAVASLPPRCRAVFQLSRFEDKTYQQIATHLDISPKTVENQMGKALRILREKLGDYLTILL
ncbi:MAG: RNA polymerase sigma-70 factor [Bacteroidota bacterium]